MALQSGSSSPCAACKILRRKCLPDQCIFAPYFPPDDPQKFAMVHNIFGACNVNKLLKELPVHSREDAANTLAYEAEARVRDPVYGCMGIIFALQHRLLCLQREITLYNTAIASFTNGAYVNDRALNALPYPAAAVSQEAQYYPVPILQALRIHREQQSMERQKLAKHRKKCLEKKDKYLGLVIDGMDQKKTMLPHFMRPPKNLKEENFIQLHVVGALVFNGIMSSKIFINFPNIHNDPNLHPNLASLNIWPLQVMPKKDVTS